MISHDFVNYPELSNTQLNNHVLSPHVQITEDFEALVVKVHDGDTVTVHTSFRDFDFPIRFAGVDAPELSEGGSDVRDWLSERLLGQVVTVLIDPLNRVGKYGRLIGRVLQGGFDLSEELLSSGKVSEFGSKNEGSFESLDKIFMEVDA